MREEEHGVGIVDDRLVVFRVYNVGHVLDDQSDAAVLFSDRFVQVFDEIPALASSSHAVSSA